MAEQEAELERIYTVPLSRAWITARHKRTRRAVNILREFAEKHMKSSEIKIDTELNEELWKNGITKPPRRITVKMEKDEDGVVTVSLPKKVKPSSAEEIGESQATPENAGAVEEKSAQAGSGTMQEPEGEQAKTVKAPEKKPSSTKSRSSPKKTK